MFITMKIFYLGKLFYSIIFTALLTLKPNPMTKKLILAALAGTIVQFLLGWLIYGLLLADFMNSHTTHYDGLMKDMNSGSFMILILLSGLVMSLLIAFIFQRWAKFEKFFMGLGGGMVLGFCIALSFDLYFLASMNLFSAGGAIVDIIANTVVTGIVGAVIAWVLGFKSKGATAQ
jgi:hypothetical protein